MIADKVVGLQAARQVKGILNKLTPENFDRLLQQVLDIVTDAEILHSTITLVFENAVAQPTFAFMYAQLCDRLSKVSGLLCSFSSEQSVGSVHLMTFFQELKHAWKGMLSAVGIYHQEQSCPAQMFLLLHRGFQSFLLRRVRRDQ